MTKATDQFYSKKGLVWGLLGLLAMCGLMKATSGAGFLAIFAVVFAGFSKNRIPVLLFALVATAALTVTNPFIAPKGFVFTIAARLVYIIAAGVMILQVVGRKAPKQLTPLLGIMPYLAYQAMTSSVGFQPIISYLKMVLFLLVFFAFYGVASAARRREDFRFERAVRTVLLIFAFYFIFGSLALIPFPGIGKMGAAAALEQGLTVESIGLFMGVTFQPQTLGPAISVISTVLLADLLFSLRRWNYLYLALLLAAPVLVYYTSSRTAMGTWLAGMCFTVFVFMCSNGVGARWKNRALGAITLVGMLTGIALFATPGIQDKVLSFVLKTSEERAAESEFSFESFTHSRQGLMDSAMANFEESPAIGNGFQVTAQMADMDIRSWKQLLSAPIEKGVWITAVLEEGGIFGFLLFCGFLLIAFPLLLSRQAYLGTCALFVFLISNLGEFTFFSTSANGGLLWAVTFVGLTLDAQRVARLRYQNAMGFRAGQPPQSFTYPTPYAPNGAQAYLP